jgi:hypothetical protein
MQKQFALVWRVLPTFLCLTPYKACTDLPYKNRPFLYGSITPFS